MHHQIHLLKKAIDLIEREQNILNRDNSAHIRKYLRRVPDTVIINETGMENMPLIVYLLWLKYGGEIRLIPIENDLVIRAASCDVARMSYLALYLHFLKFENGRLLLEGNVSYPTVLEAVRFGAWQNNRTVYGTLRDLGRDLKKGVNTYETRSVFRLEFDLYFDTEITFFNETDGIAAAYGKINAMRFSPVAGHIPGQYYEKDGWIFSIEGNKLVCKKADGGEILAREKAYRRGMKKYAPEKYEWAVGLRESYFECRGKKKKPIWLFMDRADRADDNARVLFTYVQKEKGIDSWFIIDKDSLDYEEMKKIGNVAALYSAEHYRLVLSADYIISSQCNGVVENPFWEAAELFRDLYHRPKLIFLQHGVIKDDMSRTLNRFHTNFTGFVTSTRPEYDSILNYPYDYTEREIWLTGLPRFDTLYNSPEKYILIMPSWRRGLMEQVWDRKSQNMVWRVKPGFRKSQFYRSYSSLLKNRKLAGACKKNGYRIIFVPHPLMKPYISELTRNTGCQIPEPSVSYRELFAAGKLLVTDYSSVAFDFAYLKKPVVYYQFDRETFFREHTYRPGYFDYDRDGLGKAAVFEEELVAILIRNMEHGCTLDTEYKCRMDALFCKRRGACEQIVKRIKNS